GPPVLPAESCRVGPRAFPTETVSEGLRTARGMHPRLRLRPSGPSRRKLPRGPAGLPYGNCLGGPADPHSEAASVGLRLSRLLEGEAGGRTASPYQRPRRARRN